VKYISHSNLGIDTALENVFKKSNEELLEFLYEDAWVRMNTLQKEVFLVIIHVSCPLDQVSISQACQEIGIQHSEFHSSLVETHFAILTDYGRNYSIELVDLAKRFFLQQFGKLQETDKDRLKHLASNVDKYAVARDRIEKEYKSDRVAEAFRSEYAKAAKVFANKDDIPNAIEMYELAIADDPINSALHDRFAWLLFNKTEKFDYAKRMAEKAVELDSQNCDALVDLALIHYRLEDLDSGDKYIDLSRKHGRSYSFCMLRKSIARYHQSKNESYIDNAISLLEDAERKLLIAERQNDKSDSYHAKNLKEIKKYQSLTKLKVKALRTKRTKQRHARV
jgi:tetratricopeptide (TPR) repeat protein